MCFGGHLRPKKIDENRQIIDNLKDMSHSLTILKREGAYLCGLLGNEEIEIVAEGKKMCSFCYEEMTLKQVIPTLSRVKKITKETQKEFDAQLARLPIWDEGADMLRRLVRKGLNNRDCIIGEAYITRDNKSKFRDVLNGRDYLDEKAIKEIVSILIMEKSECIKRYEEKILKTKILYKRAKNLLEQVNNGEINSAEDFINQLNHLFIIEASLKLLILLLVFIVVIVILAYSPCYIKSKVVSKIMEILYYIVLFAGVLSLCFFFSDNKDDIIELIKNKKTGRNG